MDTSFSISGPAFLGLYWGYALVVTVAYVIWKIISSRQQGRLPELNLVDPLGIAYLRGGARAVAETVVTNLVHWKKMSIESSFAGYILRDVSFLASGGGNAIENAVARALVNTNLSVSLGKQMPKALIDELENNLQGPKKMLRECGLLKPEGHRLKGVLINLGVSAVILLPGLVRLVLGIIAGRDVGFLILMILLFSFVAVISVVLALMSKPATSAGVKFAAQNSRVFAAEYQKVAAGETPQVDPSILAAMFGLGVLGLSLMPLAMQIANSGGYLGAFAMGGRGGGGSSGCSNSGCSSSGCSSSSSCGSSGCSSGCGGGCGG